MRRGARAHSENGLTWLSSRYPWENSNVRFVRRSIGSRFIALFELPADEIFSPDFGSKSADAAVDRQGLGVNVDALVGDEKQRGVGDFPARRHPSERDAGGRARRTAGAGMAAERRIDQTRT